MEGWASGRWQVDVFCGGLHVRPFSVPDVNRAANGKKKLGIGKFLKTLKRDLKRSSGTSKNNKNRLTHNLNNVPRVSKWDTSWY